MARAASNVYLFEGFPGDLFGWSQIPMRFEGPFSSERNFKVLEKKCKILTNRCGSPEFMVRIVEIRWHQERVVHGKAAGRMIEFSSVNLMMAELLKLRMKQATAGLQISDSMVSSLTIKANTVYRRL